MEEVQPARKKRRMKRRLWGELPRPVLVKVFSYLPLECLMSTRLLCRELRELGGSPMFEDMWRAAEAQRAPSFLIVKYRHTDRQHSRVYSTALRQWCNVPNKFFMPEKGFLLKDANQGLVAARLVDKIAVGNPVSGKWVELNPPPYDSWVLAMWTLLVAQDRSFKVIIENFVYHSATGKWETVNFPGSDAVGPVHQDGEVFYYMCNERRTVKLIQGKVENPSQTWVIGEWRDSYSATHKLINLGGELGLIRDSPKGVGQLSVFVFDEVKEEWVEKSQLPKEISTRVVKERWERRKERKEMSKGRERWVEPWKFVSCGRDCVGIVASDLDGLILFDCIAGSWRWVDDPFKASIFQRRSPLLAFELRL